MPFLLPFKRILFVQYRNSRHSVIKFRKHKLLLKDYRVERPDSKAQNVLETLNTAPLDTIVPINPAKTSVTIDVLDEDTFPTISEWRKKSLVRRAHRVLPLPIALTTDDKLGYRWKQYYLKSLLESRSVNDEIDDEAEVPQFVKFMFEKNPTMLSEKFPELYAKYQALIEGNPETKNDVVVGQEVYFPFSPPENPQDNVPQKHQDDRQFPVVNDEDYENYLKHNEFLQFLSKNLTTVPFSTYEPEIKGWASQVWQRNYGRSDDSVKPSQIPCSGCGAHLHCVAPNIPGFMPAERFTLFDQNELQKQLCQRCEFLRSYNVSLNVNVSDEEYPKLIAKISSKKSLIIILVDLLDFPCSVWPGIINLIGEKHLIYLVGNKVDLLPKDDQNYLQRIRKSLKESLRSTHINRDAKIRDVSLISAKTGFGVNNLVTKILRDIKSDQDVYLLGCTNAGKSTLFNVLMQTDLCAVNQGDLMTRATTSIWPGTTLNLLRFPLRKMQAWEIEMRLQRLNMMEKQDIAEQILMKNMSKQSRIHYAQLSERVNPTMTQNMPFIMEKTHPLARTGGKGKPIFGANSEQHHNAKNFLHDTPGVIYKDQLLNLLTTEELLRTIPREIITPRTYTLRPQQTLFLGGLARIDLTQARQHVWITVFGSLYLPVNIVHTEQARQFYDAHVGTEFLSVPLGDENRLKYWPNLCPKEIRLECRGWEQSCSDVVLSSAGWISITGGQDSQCVLKAFTPEGRGIFVRDPPLLPYAIRLRGKRIHGTPCFQNKVFTIDDLWSAQASDQPESKNTKYKPQKHRSTAIIQDERIKNAQKFIKGRG